MGKQVLRGPGRVSQDEGEQLNPLEVSVKPLHFGLEQEGRMKSPCSALGSFLGAPSRELHLEVVSRLGQVPRALGTPAGPSEDCAKVGTKGSLKGRGEKL